MPKHSFLPCGYEKLDRRLAEYCKSRDLKYNTILITELTPVFVNDVFDWVTNTKKGKGLSYISPMLHSIVGKAVEAGHVKEEDFAQCKWHKRQRGVSIRQEPLPTNSAENLSSSTL